MNTSKNNSQSLILAIDQGTTGTTALLVNPQLKVLASHNVEFRQIYPRPGWVEHDLDEIWRSTLKAISHVLKQVSGAPKRTIAIGITNQRETICFWSRKTGKPLCHAIVWQDRRTAQLCAEHKNHGEESQISYKTGLLLDPYFSASKIQWALHNIESVKVAASRGDLAVGTIDSFLIHKLTQGRVHATEPSNASRTMLFNIEKLTWDADLLQSFEVPAVSLPEVLGSSDQFGATYGVAGLPNGIPIHGVLGDQQAALLGQACVYEGMAKCTYGTGSFILMNTGPTIRRSTQKQLSTIAWKFQNTVTYALEGGAFTAGAAVQWVRDGLGIIKKSADIEALAKKVKSSDGVVFVPAFVGIGAPHWAPHARASFFGITRGTTQGHLARAVLEGIALMNYDILKAMEKDLGRDLQSLNVDGGASQNDLLMQFQADILGVELLRPRMIETTALGAVFAAGLGVGVWTNVSEIEKSWKKERIFKSKMKKEEKQKFLYQWDQAVSVLKTMKPL